MKNTYHRKGPASALIYRFYTQISRYRPLNRGALPLLQEMVGGQYYASRGVLCPQGRCFRDLVYVSDGYLASYALDRCGDCELNGLYGPGAIVASRSFVAQRPSCCEWQVTAGTYLLKLDITQFQRLNDRFPELQTILSLLLSEQLEAEQRRALARNCPAAQLVRHFYQAHPAFRIPGRPLPDTDIATYLGIGESTLRRERNKLLKP